MSIAAHSARVMHAKDIMYPRLSLPAGEKGKELVNKLLLPYPALPVVNDNREVIGVVSEYDILDALEEGRTMNELTAQSLMKCGHFRHTSACNRPLTVSTCTSLEEVVNLFFKEKFSILPVIEECKLVGLITRKTIINALAEEHYGPEHGFLNCAEAA